VTFIFEQRNFSLLFIRQVRRRPTSNRNLYIKIIIACVAALILACALGALGTLAFALANNAQSTTVSTMTSKKIQL
jgi:conjugal transfer/entry exclusion protein